MPRSGSGRRPGHVPGPASNGDDHLSQIERGSRLDHIRGGSGRTCRLETLISSVNEDRAADKYDSTLRLILPDQLRRLNAIQTRHHDIHRHHLWAQGGGLSNRLFAAGGTAHNLNAPIGGEGQLRRLDEIRVVINNEDADLLLLSSCHRLIPRTQKPIPKPAPRIRTESPSPHQAPITPLPGSTRPAAAAASCRPRRGRSDSCR
jgi:hypothetical protein